MGVKDLMNLLRKHCPHILHKAAQKPISGRVWVDTPLLVVAAYTRAQSQLQDPIKLVEIMLKKQVAELSALECTSIHYLFDGPSRQEKAKTRETRTVAVQARANKVFSNPLVHDLQLAQAVLNNSVLTTEEAFVKSPSMAQTQAMADSFPDMYTVRKAAKRWIDGHAFGHVRLHRHKALHDSEEYIAAHASEDDLVVSSDSDVLTFGAKHVVQHFGTKNEVWIQLDDVLQALELTQERFRWLCVLLGNDFNTRAKGCGPVCALAAVKETTFTIETFAERVDEEHRQAWLDSARASFKVFSLELYKHKINEQESA